MKTAVCAPRLAPSPPPPAWLRHLHILAALLPTLAPLPCRGGPDSAPGWTRATEPRAWSFPADHGAHPGYRTEWWYLTGNLDAGDRPFGWQLVFFRHGVQSHSGAWLPELGFPPGMSQWRVRDIHFAHFAVTDPAARRFRFTERVSRGALQEAGSDAGLLNVWNGRWFLRRISERPFRIEAGARGAGASVEFQLESVKPLVLQGQEGLSRKSEAPGAASHYYSFTRLWTWGRITLDGRSFDATGWSWLDREFSTSALATNQTGWNWFALQLDDGAEVMAYQLRNRDGGIDPSSHGAVVDGLGQKREIAAGAFRIEPRGTWRSPRTGGRYPSGWRLAIPEAGYDLEVEPFLRDQELALRDLGPLAYWEGACRVRGKAYDRPVKGRGYVELTGYAGDIGRGLRD